MQLEPDTEVIVVGSQVLQVRYKAALSHFGLHVRTLGGQAAWTGLHQIYQQLTKYLT